MSGTLVEPRAGVNLRSRFRGRWLASGAILLISGTLLTVPLLRDGLPHAHDTEEHLERYVCFVSQISEGDVYPHWLANLNGGLGSPAMFVYGPLAYYVPAALRPVLRFAGDPFRESREVGISMWIAMLLSGLTAFVWLKSVVSRRAVATFGAVLYMAMPYHLIDLYTRAAVAEVWAFAWMPLILYFAARVVQTRTPAAVAGFGVSYALLVFTHLLTTLIFTPVVVAWAFVLAKRGERRAALWYMLPAFSLGIGLSAAYLMPALLHKQYVSQIRLAQLRPLLSYENNFLPLWRGWADRGGTGDLLWKLSWVGLSTLAVAAAAFAINRNRSKEHVFWLAAAAMSTVMMFSPSSFLWKALPDLAAIQFPFRFHTILMIAAVALIAVAADSIKAPLRRGEIALVAAISALTAVWIASDANTLARLIPWRSISQPLASKPLLQDVLLGGWSEGTDQRFLKQGGILELTPEIVRNTGLYRAGISRVAAREIRLRTRGLEGWVAVPLLSYHGWIARAGDGRKLRTRAAPSGLMEIDVPAGVTDVDVAMPRDILEKASNAATVICGFLALGMAATSWIPLGQRVSEHAQPASA